MPTLLAIVSKAQFESAHALATPGDVLPFDRYDSTHAALEPLRKGGRLLLVTVRPPDERLWRVAVLESPTRTLDGWRAAKNVAPIADITELRATLRFSTGKGLSPKAGALAMSLQTPRTLTDDDARLLLGDVAEVVPGGGVAAATEVEAAEEDAVDVEPRAFDVRAFPWGRVAHAYGVAKDVPAMLASIVSDDERVRGDAWRELFASVFHQGSVYSATGPVVRHLGTLLETAALDDEVQLECLLACFVCATSGSFEVEPVLGPLPAELRKRPDTGSTDRALKNPFTGEAFVFRGREVQELGAAIRGARYAARGAMVGFARCLRGAPPGVRRQTAYVLGTLIEDGDVILPGLAAAFATEADADVAAQIVVSAAGLANGIPAWVEGALEDSRARVRIAAGYAVTCVGRGDAELLRRAARVVRDDADARTAFEGRLSEAEKEVVREEWLG
jgi:hypothetical protein